MLRPATLQYITANNAVGNKINIFKHHDTPPRTQFYVILLYSVIIVFLLPFPRFILLLVACYVFCSPSDSSIATYCPPNIIFLAIFCVVPLSVFHSAVFAVLIFICLYPMLNFSLLVNGTVYILKKTWHFANFYLIGVILFMVLFLCVIFITPFICDFAVV